MMMRLLLEARVLAERIVSFDEVHGSRNPINSDKSQQSETDDNHIIRSQYIMCTSLTYNLCIVHTVGKALYL